MAENEKLNNVAVDNDVGTMEDVDAIMKKYDRESNTRVWEGTPRKILRVLTALFGIFLIVMNMWIKMDERARRPLFLGLVIILVFIYYPIKKGSQKVNYMPWYDIVMAAVGAFCFFFYPLNLEKIVTAGTRIQKTFVVQIGSISIPLLIVFAIIGTLILVECCRRVVGMPIICVAAVFVLYAFLGAGKDLKTVMYNLFYTTTGILGTPIGVCSTYIALFVIFGAFLEATGVANFFIDCANALVGWASGGPAKVAVVSSALCGMVSGSSVGNTVTTGSVTIPMMKKTGYPPEFAGAVEAASSTGGQIMPPIMGAAAFLMAEMVGVPYADIIVRAILPAFLYFLGIFLGVHFKAKKLGLKGLPREELPKWKILLPQIYLILPLVVLVYMIMIGFTMATAAVYATLYCVVVAMISREEGKKKLVMAIPLIPLLFMTLMSRSFEPGTFMGENGSTLCLAIAFVLLVINYAISKPNVKSLPFDARRGGFVMGEGSGILVLESLEHAQARGAKIYAEVVGYGANCDAYHFTAPAPGGVGAIGCMKQALADAGVAPEQVDHINAHGTGTHMNDSCETAAIHAVFGEHAKELAVVSTKSMTGHLLGGAGGVEAVFTALALRDQFAPPTIHYEQPDPECDLDYVPNVGREMSMTYALSNSLGFGGHNACLLLRKWEG